VNVPFGLVQAENSGFGVLEQFAFKGPTAARSIRIDAACCFVQSCARERKDGDIVVFRFNAQNLQSDCFCLSGEFGIIQEGPVAAQAASCAEDIFNAHAAENNRPSGTCPAEFSK